jgi:thiazole tautomerase (transcriptional regulator TenI)
LTTPRLHVVTDDATLAREDLLRTAVGLAEAAGPDVAIHVRGHATPAARLHDIASRLVAAAAASGAVILVNDRIDVALSTRAHGVQLGRRSVPVRDAHRLAPALTIGYSAHDVNEALGAVEEGADHVVFGSVWATGSHPGRRPCGPEAVAEVAARVPVALIGIGGITPERVAAVLRAGASGVAVLSGVWAAADRLAALQRYRDALHATGSRAGKGADT